MLYPLRKAAPDKEFFLASDALVCRDMKLTTLEKVARALREMEPRVELDADVVAKAQRALRRMLELS